MLGLDLIDHGVADLVFDLYMERLFQQVRIAARTCRLFVSALGREAARHH
jgi:hypothetical protein